MQKFYPKQPQDPYYETLTAYTQLPSDTLLHYAHIEVFARGDYLSHYDTPIHTLYFLAEGKVKIYMIHDNGKQSLIQFVDQGNYIGELSLLEAETTPKDVIAVQPCVCIAFPFAAFQTALLSDAPFLRHLCVYLGRELLTRTERLSQNQTYPLINRLAAFILFTAHAGVYQEPHGETAEYLGVSYRHLLYTLEKLKSENIICKQKTGYTIRNMRALRALARDIRA